jgi:short-subunit dehydrogenase
MRPLGTAIITGAASGIGAEFARQVAAMGHDLLLIDRSTEGAHAVATELAGRYNIVAETLSADLTDIAQVRRAERRMLDIEHPAMLVNAAGFGTTGTFADIDIERQVDMIMVHVVAGVRFCRAVLPRMIAHHGGSIVNVCSISALTRFPETATYNATKAYMLVFTETLHVELAGTGVTVQALCPGLTRTGFTDTPEMQRFDRARHPAWLWMEASDVTAASLRALRHGPVRYIPGLTNRLFVSVFSSKTGNFLLGGYRRSRAYLKARVPGFAWLP